MRYDSTRTWRLTLREKMWVWLLISDRYLTSLDVLYRYCILRILQYTQCVDNPASQSTVDWLAVYSTDLEGPITLKGLFHDRMNYIRRTPMHQLKNNPSERRNWNLMTYKSYVKTVFLIFWKLVHTDLNDLWPGF